MRGCFAPVAISGRHFQVVQGNDKTYRPIASVAALTAQPLAALPPYGCGVPLAGCERPVQGYSTAQGRWCTSTLPDVSLRGGRRPTRQSPAIACVFAETALLSSRVLRDCHVASLLAMTSLIASCRRQMPKPGVRGGRILKFVTNFSFFPLDFLPEMGII